MHEYAQAGIAVADYDYDGAEEASDENSGLVAVGMVLWHHDTSYLFQTRRFAIIRHLHM